MWKSWCKSGDHCEIIFWRTSTKFDPSVKPKIKKLLLGHQFALEFPELLLKICKSRPRQWYELNIHTSIEYSDYWKRTRICVLHFVWYEPDIGNYKILLVHFIASFITTHEQISISCLLYILSTVDLIIYCTMLVNNRTVAKTLSVN